VEMEDTCLDNITDEKFHWYSFCNDNRNTIFVLKVLHAPDACYL